MSDVNEPAPQNEPAAPNQPAPVSARRSGVTPQAVVVDEGGDVMGATIEAVRTARREAGDGRAAVIAPKSSIADIRTGLDPDLRASDGPDPDVLDAPVAVLSLAGAWSVTLGGVVSTVNVTGSLSDGTPS